MLVEPIIGFSSSRRFPIQYLLAENFDTKNGREITLKGFLDLNLMEARDAEGDPNDLWVTFNSMGYNKGLEPDQVLYMPLNSRVNC